MQFSQPNMLQYPTGVILLHTSCLPHGVFFKTCFKETSFNKIDNYYYFKKDIFSNCVRKKNPMTSGTLEAGAIILIHMRFYQQYYPLLLLYKKCDCQHIEKKE